MMHAGQAMGRQSVRAVVFAMAAHLSILTALLLAALPSEPSPAVQHGSAFSATTIEVSLAPSSTYRGTGRVETTPLPTHDDPPVDVAHARFLLPLFLSDLAPGDPTGAWASTGPPPWSVQSIAGSAPFGARAPPFV